MTTKKETAVVAAEQTATNLQNRIALIMGEIGAIEKKKAEGGPQFAFRSIDEVMNKLNPLLAKHEITITSEVVSHTLNSRTYTKWDGYQKKEVEKFAFYATVLLRVQFRHGSEVETWEEIAMSEDNSDKALTQAMSMAYKYAILRKFCILTKDVSESDADKKPNQETQTPPPPVAKDVLTKDHPRYKGALDSLLQGVATMDKIKSVFEVSAEMQTEMETLRQKAEAARIKGGKA